MDTGLKSRFTETMYRLLRNYVEIDYTKVETLFKEWDHIIYREGFEEYWDLFRTMILLRRLGVTPYPWLVEEIYETIVNIWVESYWFEEGAIETIKKLKNLGYKIGIISNAGSYDAIYRQMKRAGLTYAVDVIIVSQAVSWKKPSYKIFRIALDMIDAEPKKAVHVGDDPKADVEGAKKAGLWAVQKIKENEKISPYADAVVYKIVEIPRILQDIERSMCSKK